MKKELFATTPPIIEPLALCPRDAAQALGISERLLWDWAHQHGLPYVQIGRLVLYPVDGIRLWLRDRSAVDDTVQSAPSAPHALGRQHLAIETV